MNVTDAPIVALGTMAVLAMAATISIFWIGLFAILSGRDTVWECSWRWPSRLLARLEAMRDARAILGLRVAFARFVAGESARPAAADARLRTLSQVRRPTSHHYLPVGARARMQARARGTRPSGRAA